MTCAVVGLPSASVAQQFDQAPSGSFTFGNFGVVNAEALPLEIASESPSPSGPRRVTTSNLDVAVRPNGVETTRVTSRTIQNTWAIGVFR